jgi:alkanesulfonate monooxygenase SsuD/methylene tetrahydromethanopterin reductase-like flavin-dependent oxidoreductase (luciferase family)
MTDLTGEMIMLFGAAMFFTDYSMSSVELARALEERGFESVWAPEHSHIPLTRKTPFAGGGELPKQYYDVMDPFVASIDQVSHGRFLFGIGGGWNQDEMEDHGTVYATRFKKMREQVEAMQAIWADSKPEYHGEIVDFPPMMTWPKPVQKPHPPVIVGGMFPHAARRALRYGDGWIPHSRRPHYEDVTDFLPQFRQMAAEAGRNLAEVPVTVWGVPPDYDRLRRYEEQGVSRGVVQLAPEKSDKTLPILDHWAELIGNLG